ncbi:stage V sporulation protein S (plasmid) [Pontibacillus sp. ALD_SL1]|uniref:stage V sporulation protein S n=1 Tax=Pontibacillus sp. ALD_SL1 TaxID=2777185 RepID=UPI001A9627B7|nr:stage V sporulation protein S [Pontibacillus sp. ALD_SL1]QST02955.1 stage V sporulation protein S [Pontibacillus sp. ALD_SL1]
MATLKVKNDTKVNKLAGSIAEYLRAGEPVELHAIGAGSVNQAVKGLATARGYVASNGIDFVVVPAFMDIKIDDEDRTAMRLIVKY